MGFCFLERAFCGVKPHKKFQNFEKKIEVQKIKKIFSKFFGQNL